MPSPSGSRIDEFSRLLGSIETDQKAMRQESQEWRGRLELVLTSIQLDIKNTRHALNNRLVTLELAKELAQAKLRWLAGLWSFAGAVLTLTLQSLGSTLVEWLHGKGMGL